MVLRWYMGVKWLFRYYAPAIFSVCVTHSIDVLICGEAAVDWLTLYKTYASKSLPRPLRLACTTGSQLQVCEVLVLVQYRHSEFPDLAHTAVGPSRTGAVHLRPHL